MRTKARISTQNKLLAQFLLVAVLSQTLLSFVCGHLMALSFLTARHCFAVLIEYLKYL